MSGNYEREISFEDGQQVFELYGINDKHLKIMETALEVRLRTHGNRLIIRGEKPSVERAEKILSELYSMISEGYLFQETDWRFIARIASEDSRAPLREVFSEKIQVSSRRRYVSPKSVMQRNYVKAMREHDIVFGIGPAGTGKTYLAMAMGVSGLLQKEFTRIILTRPAVEAGEKLGFLPGDLHEKVNPYLRPLYDALYDMMEFESAQKLMERGTIEIAPLAYMRGRSLNDSFIILDEAQNTTSEQMKMFLTRIGFNSRAVITGDITQVDLPEGRTSGLIEVMGILGGIKGIKFIRFSDKDVIRHDLVQKIIRAYERYEEGRKQDDNGE